MSAKLELMAVNEMPRVTVRMFGAFALHCDGELTTSGAGGGSIARASCSRSSCCARPA